jgi:uncharacterized protein DUF4276
VGLERRNLGGKLQNAGKFAVRYLDDRETLAVFTLIDLQGNNRILHQPQDSLEVKVQRVREWLRAQVSHDRADRFFPHVCVHQTEAWFLAEGRALAARLKEAGILPDSQAESRNFENPPSRRLNELFLRFTKSRYTKISDGTPLFKAMEFQPVYDSCEYFRRFYDDLRGAGRQ